MFIKRKISDFIKKEAVFVIASLCALISMFFVIPDREYIDYIDYRVIGLLFILMSVVAGFSELGVFQKISEYLISRIKNLRLLVMVLWMLCFFSSMIITNDVVLITFVPLAITVLTLSGNKKYIIYTLVLQTIASNLGSMLTPMGNPQNLYLYSYFGVSAGEFFKITTPVIILSFAMLLISSMFVKSSKMEIDIEIRNMNTDIKFYIYIVLLVLAILTVFKMIDYRIVLVITIIAELLFDRGVFKNVDWFLLLTFVSFFIFVGNIARIDIIKSTVINIIRGRELIVGVLSSQVISNVPAAVMLSTFTDNYRGLILGTNIGGLGTLIASLASLISFKIYSRKNDSNIKKYIALFTAVNIIFILILLTVFSFYYTI